MRFIVFNSAVDLGLIKAMGRVDDREKLNLVDIDVPITRQDEDEEKERKYQGIIAYFHKFSFCLFSFALLL